MQERTADSSAESMPGDDVNPIDAKSKCLLLWTALSGAHAQLNALARSGAHASLSELHKQNLAALFREVHSLISANFRIAGVCPLIENDQHLSCSEALLLVGQHRAALREYRVEVLGEDPFRLHN